MVNSIHNLSKMQEVSGVSQAQPVINNYYTIKPQAPDSYNGKTLKKVVTIAGIAAALLFHKNIAGVIKKYAPSLCDWSEKHVGKHIKTYISNHNDNIFVQKAVSSKGKLAYWGESIIDLFKTKKV